MDWRIFHSVDEFSSHHRWLAHATYGFETLGVAIYAAAVALLWLAAEPGEERRLKIAALSGAFSGTLALLINQVIGHIWHRLRPYETHAHVYHLTNSRDPSFPSDHASAAFGIAFGIYAFDRRAGWVFIAFATLIAVGRIVVGAHYLSDVLASVLVAALAALVVWRFGRRVLYRLVGVLERVSDPIARRIHQRGRQQAAR